MTYDEAYRLLVSTCLKNFTAMVLLYLVGSFAIFHYSIQLPGICLTFYTCSLSNILYTLAFYYANYLSHIDFISDNACKSCGNWVQDNILQYFSLINCQQMAWYATDGHNFHFSSPFSILQLILSIFPLLCHAVALFMSK